MYDFALYENVTTGINHQKDLHMIARLLKDSGYSVCVLDYCKEKDFGDGIPFIRLTNPYRIPEMEYGPKWTIFYRLMRFHYNKRKYISCFLNETKNIARNYYCGSFLQETDVRFLQQSIDTNYFFWGLRSHWVKMNLKDWLHPIKAIRKYRKILLVKKQPNIKFFISNEFIKQEFIDCGISADRLVLRPERYIDSSTISKPKFTKPFTFLSIGTIRKEKRIPMAISAFKNIYDYECLYDIAGKCNDIKLNDQILRMSNNDTRITRNENRLSEEDYQGYFDRCHFLLLCDVLQQSSVTNGTMMEAIMKGKPIIAPNYDPYRYYVEKYNIGLLFDGDSADSLCQTMKEAINMGAESFEPALQLFRQLFLYDKIQKQFEIELNQIGIVSKI